MPNKNLQNQKVQQLIKKLSEILDLHDFAKYNLNENLITELRQDPEKARGILETAFLLHLEKVDITPRELRELEKLAYKSSYEVMITEICHNIDLIKSAILMAHNHYREQISEFALTT